MNAANSVATRSNPVYYDNYFAFIFSLNGMFTCDGFDDSVSMSYKNLNDNEKAWTLNGMSFANQ